MRNALRAKNKLRFIDGTLMKQAEDSFELEDWWMVNLMLVAWIFNTIEPSLRSTITYMENVHEESMGGSSPTFFYRQRTPSSPIESGSRFLKATRGDGGELLWATEDDVGRACKL